MIYILLIIVGITLIIVNLSVLRKEENSFLNTLKNKEENFSDTDEQLIAIRKDMAESILDIQHEIESLRNEIIKLQNAQHNKKLSINNSELNDDIELEDEDKGVISEINFGNSEKTEKIKEMINKGKSDEEICNSLGIGKGEVLLIRELIK